MSKDTILEVNDLKQYYPIRGGVFQRKVGEVKAVDGVSFKMMNCQFKRNTSKFKISYGVSQLRHFLGL